MKEVAAGEMKVVVAAGEMKQAEMKAEVVEVVVVVVIVCTERTGSTFVLAVQAVKEVVVADMQTPVAVVVADMTVELHNHLVES